MENSVISSKRKSLKLNIERALTLKGVKWVFAALFGFISALPFEPLGVSPLAVSTVAVMPQNYVVASYLGAFFSYLSNSFYESAASVSALTAIMLFKLLFKKEGKASSDIYIAPLSVIISLCVTGILCGDISSHNVSGTIIWLLLSSGAALSTIPFKILVNNYGKSIFRLSLSQLTGVAVSVFLLLLPLGKATIWGANLIGIIATSTSLCLGIKLNRQETLAVSVFFGASWSLATLNPFPVFVLPVCIMISKSALPLGKLPYLACFISLKFATNLILSPIIELIPQMIETLISALFIVVLPSVFLKKRRILNIKPKESANKYASEKIKETASLFRFLSDSIAEVSEAVSKELAVSPEGCVKHIRETLCSNCELSKFCCGVKNAEVSEAIRAVADDIITEGSSTHPLPRCAHRTDMNNRIKAYIGSTSSSTEESNEIRALSTDSYKIVSEVLTEISEELTTAKTEISPIESIGERIDISALQFKNDREIHSGDNYEYFLKGKFLYIIISDGMGSGRIASIDSKMTCGLLKRFLGSGFSFTSSIKLTNAALKLKVGDETFATADICRIDTEDGSVSLGKAGAAASYIISESRIRKLNTLSLPLGILNETRFEEVKLKLRKGDYLLMLSDGAVNNGDEWLEEEHFYGMTTEKICNKILKIAKESYGSFSRDDITVICTRLK